MPTIEEEKEEDDGYNPYYYDYSDNYWKPKKKFQPPDPMPVIVHKESAALR